MKTMLWPALAVVLAACSGAPPYRTAIQAQPGYDCAAVYRDGHIADDIKAQGARASCWLSSWERHPSYDLYSVEFDDQGWLADELKYPGAKPDQISNLMQGLETLSAGNGNPQPLSLVIYTHGWHHSAKPDDDNVAAFRVLLAGTDTVERDLCLARRHLAGTPPPGVCTDGEQVPAWQKKRHVVGVYVGWRGDSVQGWGLKQTSIWDRKLAAEKVSHGSVIEFYDRLHAYYSRHNCHSGARLARKLLDRCADVRMLTIGHSFGGLITYRALEPTLLSNIIETAGYGSGGTAGIPYAYSFGELTVLLNPAFEGTRFEPLARAAAARDYQPGQESGPRPTAQLPMLLVVQSKGDDATGDLFPLFRRATTLFESTDGPENQADIHTVGWTRRYQTHELRLDPAFTACDPAKGPTCLDQTLTAEAQWYERQRRDNWLRIFNAQHLAMSDGLLLDKLPPESDAYALARPNFMPVWVIMADTTVIKDHNDFLNPHLVDFVRQVYSAILNEEDRNVEQVRSGKVKEAAAE